MQCVDLFKLRVVTAGKPKSIQIFDSNYDCDVSSNYKKRNVMSWIFLLVTFVCLRCTCLLTIPAHL